MSVPKTWRGHPAPAELEKPVLDMVPEVPPSFSLRRHMVEASMVLQGLHTGQWRNHILAPVVPPSSLVNTQRSVLRFQLLPQQVALGYLDMGKTQTVAKKIREDQQKI